MPFASGGVSLRGMTQRRRDTRAILRTVAQSEQRSSLFRWMVEHHDEMVEASRQERIHWASFCAQASKRGLTDAQGKAPTTVTARKTWTRARQAVREARAELAARPTKPVFPSRMPKWTPPEILAAIEAGNPAVEGARGSSVSLGLTARSTTGTAMVARSPPPRPPVAQAGAAKPLSQFAKPDDPIEVQEALRSAEDQLKKLDGWMIKE